METPAATATVQLHEPALTCFQDEGARQLCRVSDQFLVQVTALDENGQVVQQGSGFLSSSTDPLIMTCDHIRYAPVWDTAATPPAPAAVRYKVKYAANGAEEEASQLVSIPDADLLVLKGSHTAPPGFTAATAGVGDTVYVAAFHHDLTRHSKGAVSSVTLSSMELTAYADNGWSGGPVVNARGQLVGMIQKGVGETIKQPHAIVPAAMDIYLRISHLPGLPAPSLGPY